MENNNEQMREQEVVEQEEKEKKKKGIFKLYRTRVIAIATAITVGISSIAILNGINKKHEHDVPNTPDSSVTEYDPSYDDDHNHNHTYNPDDNTVVIPTPGPVGPSEPVVPSETEGPEENKGPSVVIPGPGEVTPGPGEVTTDPGEEITDPEDIHVHVYSQLTVEYKDNGNGTHTRTLVGTCPKDGATKVLLKGIPVPHNYDVGVVDPKTGDTTYTCKDCGSIRVVEKEQPGVHTHDYSQTESKYEDNGDGTHTLVTVGICPADGATKVLKKGTPQAHNYGAGVVDPKTGDTVYTCKDCGSKKVVQKGPEEHTHDYSIIRTGYEDNGNGTHTLVTTGTCPVDGATKVLRKGTPQAHNYGAGVVDPKTGDTVYTCKDCGSKKIVEKEKPGHEHTIKTTVEYEQIPNDAVNHRIITTEECTSCSDYKKVTPSEGAHHFGTAVVDKDGNTVYTCTDCGYQKVIVKEHGHNYEVTTHYEKVDDQTHRLVTVKTCTEPGCPEDQRVITTYGQPVPHTLKDIVDASGKVIGQECTADGCGYKKLYNHEHDYSKQETRYINDGDTHSVQIVGICPEDQAEKVISTTPGFAHQWDAGTENADGTITYKCVCGATKVHTHDYSQRDTKVVDNGDGTHTTTITGTCPEDGKTKIISSVVGSHSMTYNGNHTEEGDEYSCSCGKTEIRPHAYDSGTEVPDLGKIVYVCQNCGHEKTEDLEKPPVHTEHNYTYNGNHTEEGDEYSCSCGKTEIRPHAYDSGTEVPDLGKIVYVCQNCGHEKTEDLEKPPVHTEHNYTYNGNHTEEGDEYSCSCGKTEIRPHAYDSGTEVPDLGKIVYVCQNCGHEKTEDLEKPPVHTEHNYTYNGNHTEEGDEYSCSCGKTEIRPHAYDSGTEVPDLGKIVYVCQNCGHEKTEDLEKPPVHTEHNYTYNGNHTEEGDEYSCSCGKTEIRPHAYDSGTEVPDLGKIVYVCQNCGHEKVERLANNGPELDTNKQTLSTESLPAASSETVENGTEITESVQETESAEPVKTTVQIQLPGELTDDGKDKTVEFEVSEEMADQVIREAQDSIEEALAGSREQEGNEQVASGGSEPEDFEDVEEAEDDKVLTLDNNKYYY